MHLITVAWPLVFPVLESRQENIKDVADSFTIMLLHTAVYHNLVNTATLWPALNDANMYCELTTLIHSNIVKLKLIKIEKQILHKQYSQVITRIMTGTFIMKSELLHFYRFSSLMKPMPFGRLTTTS